MTAGYFRCLTLTLKQLCASSWGITDLALTKKFAKTPLNTKIHGYVANIMRHCHKVSTKYLHMPYPMVVWRMMNYPQTKQPWLKFCDYCIMYIFNTIIIIWYTKRLQQALFTVITVHLYKKRESRWKLSQKLKGKIILATFFSKFCWGQLFDQFRFSFVFLGLPKISPNIYT